MSEQTGFIAWLWETMKTVFWELLLAGIFRTLFFQPFWIPSGSMKDTLLIGDFLFVNKMAYGIPTRPALRSASHNWGWTRVQMTFAVLFRTGKIVSSAVIPNVAISLWSVTPSMAGTLSSGWWVCPATGSK